MWEELNHSENPFLLSSSFFSTGYIDCNFLPAIWNVSCFKHRVSAACGTNFQTVYSFFIFPSSPEWYHSFKLCFPDRLGFPFIHFDLWLSHMASLVFFYHLNEYLSFHILDEKLKGEEMRRPAPGACQSQEWVSGMSAASLYFHIYFVYV